MTIEYQRAQAKDLVRYFREQKEAQIADKAQCAPPANPRIGLNARLTAATHAPCHALSDP